MFDNSTDIFCFSYKTKLDKIVKPICSIASDISEQILEDFSFTDLFHDEFITEIGKRKSDLENKSELFSAIGNYYNTSIFDLERFDDGIEILEQSNILFLIREENIIFFIGDNKPNALNSTITNYIKKIDIDNDLIEKISSKKIIDCLSSVSLFDNTILYNKSVESKYIGQQVAPFIIPFELLVTDKINIESVDRNSFWINKSLLHKKFGIDLVEAELEYYSVESKEADKQIGFKVGNWFIPHGAIRLENYVVSDQSSRYIWSLFENVFKDKRSILTHETELTKSFKAANNNAALNKLLSYLEYNLYIPFQHAGRITADFEIYFDEVALIDKLEPYLATTFFISKSDESQLALGIYSAEKVNKKYNLLHWIEQSETGYLNHEPDKPAKKHQRLIIQTLKPDVAFYFLRKYFEDVIENILHSNDLEYLSNFNLKDGTDAFEIDFLVKKGNAFLFIEAKTKLTKLYIEDYIVKCTKLSKKIKDFAPDIILEFAILGSYSESLEGNYKHFIDIEEHEHYNNLREDLNSIPYNFKVPIPELKDTYLQCIAEPEYEKLQDLLLKICQ